MRRFSFLRSLNHVPDMSRQPEDEITEVLKHVKPGNLVRSRGKPVANPFFWPDRGALGSVEREVEMVARAEMGIFTPDSLFVRYKIREFLWRVYRDGDPGEPRIKSSAKRLMRAIRVPLVDFDVMWDVANLDLPDGALSAGPVQLGVLDCICQEHAQLLRARYSWVASANILARTQVQAPDRDLAIPVSREEVEDALDILCVTYARTRISLGDFDGLSVGENVVFLDPDPAQVTSRWVRGRRNFMHVVLPNSAWNGVGSLRKAPVRPWESVPPTAPISELLQRAYRRFGQAVRNQGDANACLPLAMSSLEVLLGPEHPNRYVLASRLVRASLLAGQAVPHPVELANWYDMRSKVLHEGRAIKWTNKGQDLLWDTYEILDAISALCIREGIPEKAGLVAVLSTQPIVKQAAQVIDTEIKNLETVRNQAVSSTAKTRLNRTIEEWKRIRGQVRN
jgi:hypothetical protein